MTPMLRIRAPMICIFMALFRDGLPGFGVVGDYAAL